MAYSTSRHRNAKNSINEVTDGYVYLSFDPMHPCAQVYNLLGTFVSVFTFFMKGRILIQKQNEAKFLVSHISSSSQN